MSEGYKYWRISNITSYSNIAITGNYLELVTSTGEKSNNPNNVSALRNSESLIDISHGFDNSGKGFHSYVFSQGGDIEQSKAYWIQYTFDNPCLVTKFIYRNRLDVPASFGQTWKTASLYYSEDGVNWNFYADVSPNIASGDTSLVIIGIERHRWWRVSNIKFRTEASYYSTFAELDFVNTENIITNNPNNVIFSSQLDGYPASNAFDKDPNTLTTNNYPYEYRNNYWIGYRFDSSVSVKQVSVKMRNDMGPNYGQEWQTADVDYSDDGNTWINYGIITPNIAIQDSNLITTPIIFIKNIYRIVDKAILFAEDYTKKWSNIITRANTIFSLDWNRVLTNDGRTVYLNKNDYIYVENNLPWRVTKDLVTAPEIQDFLLRSADKTYKTLQLNDIKLMFSNPISPSNEMTFILKCKHTGSSCFLGKNTSTYDYHGLLLDLNDYGDSYSRTWRIAGQVADQSPKRNSSILRQGWDTVVLRIDKVNRKGQIITTWNTTDLPDSFFDNTGFFPFAPSWTTMGLLGYTLNAYVVAYGMFDKYLTDEEIGKVLLKIDDDLLVDNNKIKTNKQLSYKYTNNKSIDIIAKKVQQSIVWNSNIKVKEVLINKYVDITDIVYEEGVPVQTKLFLYEKYSGKLIASTVSKLDGTFTFKNIDKTFEYIVTSFDKKYQYKSIIKDFDERG